MNDVAKTATWAAVGFALGAVPFSLWLGRLFAHADIRHYGDGNPGASNAWRAAGWRVGVAAMLLDALKGFLPVGLAHLRFGVRGWGLVIVALAPVVGHAFSPLLRGRGGKAVAVTFGIWTGLTLGEGPILLGILVSVWMTVLAADAWTILLAMLCFLLHLLLRHAGPFTLLIWAGNVLILIWKHRRGLREPIRLSPWIVNRLRR